MKKGYTIVYAERFPINDKTTHIVIANYKNTNSVCIAGYSKEPVDGDDLNDDDVAIFRIVKKK